MKKSASSILIKGSSANNSFALQNMINKSDPKTCILFPDGDFYFNSQIILNKGIYLQGSEKTNLYFKGGSNAILISGGKDADKTILKDLNLFSPDDRHGLTNCGIKSNSIVIMENIWVKNFGGTGILFQADISSGGNASFSKLDNCLISECGAGIYLSGGDTNQIGFYHIDIRDCDGWGVHDNSFLGCNWFGCMTHANKLGGYKVGVPIENANSRAGLFGCYTEGDQPNNEYCGRGTVIGGRCGGNSQWKITGGDPLIMPEDLIYKP